MTAHIVNDIADVIRREDGNNRAKPETLAMGIVDGLQDLGIYAIEWKPLAEFIQRTNPDKKLGASSLAELIVAEFDLDKEN